MGRSTHGSLLDLVAFSTANRHRRRRNMLQIVAHPFHKLKPEKPPD
jgi:hypothetical protein